jgi:DNA repair protein RadC
MPIICWSVWDKNRLELQEQFKVILLNKNHRVLGVYETCTGSTWQPIVDPKLIFAAALKAHTSAINLAHNHPSGELNPSKEDIAITAK